ncbi:hypothetical protein OAV21_01770 [bacterium]|nr:hypothetical protein [bacterium]
MKTRTPFMPAVIMLSLPFSHILAGGFPVVDVAQIASNKLNWATDLAQQVLQEANQQTQIANELEQIAQLYEQIDQLTTQIAQVDDYLDRFGDPETITELVGLDGLLDQLGEATDALDIAERMGDITGAGIFEFDGGGIFQEIDTDIAIDGEVFARDAVRYKPEDAIKETVEQFRGKKLDVIERRDLAREEISSTIEALKEATTDSEVKKLTGVLLGQQTELQAIDRELDIAANENAARELENANQRRAEAKARTEAEVRKFEVANRRDVATYQIDQSRYGW